VVNDMELERKEWETIITCLKLLGHIELAFRIEKEKEYFEIASLDWKIEEAILEAKRVSKIEEAINKTREILEIINRRIEEETKWIDNTGRRIYWGRRAVLKELKNELLKGNDPNLCKECGRIL